jgi:hypothetical protein
VSPPAGAEQSASRKRYYSFSQGIPYFTEEQTLCNGCTQFYSTTPSARDLLRQWHASIARFPGHPDDRCLDFTFNNTFSGKAGFQVSWLPKHYARYPWWFWVKPVIDHPDVPAQPPEGWPQDGAAKAWYPERAERVYLPLPFPRDVVIDVEERVLLRTQEDGSIKRVARFRIPVWP